LPLARSVPQVQVQVWVQARVQVRVQVWVQQGLVQVLVGDLRPMGPARGPGPALEAEA
jgi:hypothetical protein